MALTTLLLPGMHGTSRLFGRLIRSLPNSLRSQTVDYPVDEIFSYESLLNLIELPREPFAIVAESYSGPLAIRLAARRPEPLRGLILVATFASNPRPMIPNWAGWLIQPWLFRLPIPFAVMRRTLLGDDSPPDLVAEIRREQQRNRPKVLAARVRDVLRVDVRSYLPEISVPTLYIGGSRDRVVPRSAALELIRLQPDMKYVLIDAPHTVLQSNPHAAAAAIASFLL